MMMDVSAAGSAHRTRVAIVGAGFGRYGLAPAFRRDPRCEIVAVCTSSSASALRAAQELGVDRWYADTARLFEAGGFDALAIATPPAIQAGIARAAIARSLPVFAEKLLATSLLEAQELAAIAQAAGVANVVDYIFPEVALWRAAHARVTDGELGQLRHISVSWMLESHDQRHQRRTWKTEAGAGGGVLHHFGPHVLHYLEWFMGPVKSISASLGRAPDCAPTGETVAALAVEFTSGASGAVTMSTAAPMGSGHRIEIYGSEGMMSLCNTSLEAIRGFQLRMRSRGDDLVFAGDEAERSDSTIDSRVEPVARIASRFLDWIHEGRQTRPSFTEGARVLLLLDAAERSAASGRIVAVPGERSG